MSIDVNLISKKSPQAVFFEKTLSVVKTASIIAVVITISLCVIAFFVGRASSLSNLQLQTQLEESKLTKLTDISQNLMLVHNRIKNIEVIAKSQYKYERILSTATDQIPSDVNISEVAFTDKTLTLTISSTSLTSIQKTTDNFTKLINNKNTFSEMSLQGIVGDSKSGIYQLSFTLTIL